MPEFVRHCPNNLKKGNRRMYIQLIVLDLLPSLAEKRRLQNLITCQKSILSIHVSHKTIVRDLCLGGLVNGLIGFLCFRTRRGISIIRLYYTLRIQIILVEYSKKLSRGYVWKN